MYHVILILRQFPTTTKFCRSISLFTGSYRQKEKTKQSFVPVYKFPYIVPLSLVNKFKMYQTTATVVSVPGAALLSQLNYISIEALQFVASLGVSGCLTLYGLGYLTNKFIGFIYYNEETDVAKVSYIDFWGKRKDLEIPTNDIVPLNELPITPLNGLFFTIRRFSTKETLRLNLRYGIILDKEKIKNIF